MALLISIGSPLASAATELSFTPSSLAFKYQAGTALPAAQTLQIKSTGSALNFTIAITGQLPYSAQWLSVSANSGTTTASIKVYVNPTGLPSGTFTGTIVVSAPAATTPTQNFTVTLDVGDPAANLTTSTPAMTFGYVTGQTAPASQTLVVMSTGGALSATITLSGGSWLKASPNGSITLVGLPGTVVVSVDPSGLAPNTYSGTITFASSTAANKSVKVAVTLNVSAGVPTITNVWPPGAQVNSAGSTVTVTGTNFFATSTAAIGTTTLTTAVLSPTGMLVTVPATLMTTAGNLSIVVSTPTAASSSAPATFVVYNPVPQIWAVANSASYATGNVSPGGVITIYGLGLGPSTLAVFPGTNPIPTTLPAAAPSTSITIDGKAAPILYTSATQVSCIVPYSVVSKVGAKVDLIVTFNGAASTATKVTVVDADPGIFTIDSSGGGQGAILNYNATSGDYTVNSSSNAATKGSTVVIYITGFGQTNPAGNEANLISGTVNAVATVGVTIDGQSAAVQGTAAPAGSVPGVLQINATVPANAKSGNTVPVIVTVGAAQSQGRVTMAVK